MEVPITENTPDIADGVYHIAAQCCEVATLYWADQNGILPHWTPLARLPLGEDGRGEFRCTGQRAIPAEATHLLALAEGEAGTQQTLLPLPNRPPRPQTEASLRVIAMSDLHLSRKPWQVRRALHLAKDADLLLLAGDMTNDGKPSQMQAIRRFIEEILPDAPVLDVAGNHDYPIAPLPRIPEGTGDYAALQAWLLERTEGFGFAVTADPSGAYAVRMGDTEIIGLNAVSHWRRFVFHDGLQLQWLEAHLAESTADRHIILCHAPLLSRNPKRRSEAVKPSLSRDDQLQQIIDRHRNILFLSGHTHVSLNSPVGCVEYDRERRNIFLNDGSIRPTTLLTDEPLVPDEFVSGNAVELLLTPEQTVITGICIGDGRRIARGHYIFSTPSGG